MLRDHVEEEVGRKLRKLGFRKKGSTWRRESDFGIEVFNIQGSQFGGGAFYLNVGLYRGDDRNLTDPKEYECQHRERIDHENRTAAEVFEAICSWFEKQSQWLAERSRLPPAAAVRVKHAKFGAGTIVADKGNTVEVAFDDGTTRVLAKSFVEIL